MKPRRGDSDGEMATYRVSIDWSYTVDETSEFDVEASSEDEAREIGEQMCRDEDGSSEGFEIIEASVRRMDA